jgi:hypothetical protein
LRNRILLLLAFSGLITSISASAVAQSIFSGITYSVGGGRGIGRDDVAAFVGTSPQGVVGIGKNFTRLFGADVEYMYYDLPFRSSVKLDQFLADQSGRMQSISVDGIVTAPRHIRKWGAYGILGIGFYDRTVSVPRQKVAFNTLNEPAYRWWDLNTNILGQITEQYMSSNSKVAGGFNYGGGVTHPLNHLHNAKFFAEFRYHRAYQSDGQTIVMPITVGLRW